MDEAGARGDTYSVVIGDEQGDAAIWNSDILEEKPPSAIVSNDSPGGEEKQTDELPQETKQVEEGDFPLSMSFQDAILSLKAEFVLLEGAMMRMSISLYFSVVVGILLAGGTPTLRMFNQASAVTEALAPEKTSVVPTIQFHDIDTVDDVYTWLTDTLIPSVFVTTDQNGDLLPVDQRGRVGLFNQVLGGVMLEMTPRTFTACSASHSYVDIYPNCTDFDSRAQTSTTFLAIDLNSAKASAVIADLKKTGTWVNFDTLQLVVSVVTYNPESKDHRGCFTVTKLKVSFMESGPQALELTATTTTVSDFRGTKSLTLLLTTGIIGLALGLHSCFIARVVMVIPKYHGSVYCKTRHYLSLITLTTIKYGAIPGFIVPWIKVTTTNFSSVVQRIVDSTAQGTQESIDNLKLAIVEFDTNARWVDALSILGALAIGQLGLFVIRQFRVVPQLNVFARTVTSALRQFSSFSLVFIVIFLAFSFSGNVLFGHRVRQFSSVWYSMQTCINMLFGAFDYGYIKDIRGSGLFYWGYMVVVSIILLNMMLAIVMATYEIMRKESHEGKVNVIMTTRFLSRSRNVRATIGPRHPCRTKPSEDDKLAVKRFERYGMDLHKLEHKDVVLYGKIRPLLLWFIIPDKWKELCEIEKTENDNPSANCTDQLTPAILREMLPAAGLSDDEMRATFKFLHEGLMLSEVLTSPSLQAEGDNGKTMGRPNEHAAPRLKPASRALPTIKPPKDEAVDNTTSGSIGTQEVTNNSTELSDVPIISPELNILQEEVAAMHTRVVGLEQKIDRLLEAVLLSRGEAA